MFQNNVFLEKKSQWSKNKDSILVNKYQILFLSLRFIGHFYNVTRYEMVSDYVGVRFNIYCIIYDICCAMVAHSIWWERSLLWSLFEWKWKMQWNHFMNIDSDLCSFSAHGDLDYYAQGKLTNNDYTNKTFIPCVTEIKCFATSFLYSLETQFTIGSFVIYFFALNVVNLFEFLP